MARALVGFKEASLLLDFVQTMSEQPYVDERGVSHKLQIEFAPYQAIPKVEDDLSDPLCGTLDDGTMEGYVHLNF